ncbi:MAG TPA: glycosyltransferase family 9 protein, partial [Flavobacterium sp.]|nr:glycosyltransferase family 9 protein [Flavobacterium sp.]
MKHILVIRLSAMGDVAMTVPVIRAAVAQHPNIRITVVSRPFFKPFFEGIERVDFFGVDLKQRHKGFAGLTRLYSDLKKRNIDGVADLHNVLRSKIVRTFFKLSGTKVAFLNKGRSEKKALTREENKIFKPLKSMHQRYADVFEQLGFKIDLSKVSFPEKGALSAEVKTITGEKSGKWIGIAPFAQY